jgi:hypothetical protein
MAEYVRDGIDGLHFQAGDDADLAAKMRRFLDEPSLIERLSRDANRVKTIEEDAAMTEVRYRQLVASRTPRAVDAVPRVLVDRTGVETVKRTGPCEQQGSDMLLLRNNGNARAEYDLSWAGAGRRTLLLEQFAFGAEAKLPLGLLVSVDDRVAGEFPAFASEGTDAVRSHEIALDLGAGARRLVLETLPLPTGGRTYARVKRIVLTASRQAENDPQAQPAPDHKLDPCRSRF